MELDYVLLRRYAKLIQGKTSLDAARTQGWVQDANDEELWNLAATDPQTYTKNDPDTEIVDPQIHDMSVFEEMYNRLFGENND